mmetsp:Transcript_124091/g.396807  ORF Transcript_124091/g.396807 Transcript_124091/m.396807 type:complete len:465 (-) Transcript_124091:455-1849(-)
MEDFHPPERTSEPVSEEATAKQVNGTTAPTPVCKPFIIGIAGGTASGKSTVCRLITQSLGGQRVTLLSLDEFYRDLTDDEKQHISDVNFDEPSAFDVDSLVQCLDALGRCEPTDVPVYDFVSSRRCPDKTRRVNAADVVIVEGILVLHLKDVIDRCNMKVFVDTPDDLRLARRIRRDTVERGRDVESVINQYTRFVKPSFDAYVLPGKINADVIIPWRDDRPVAVDLITQHVRLKLSQNNLGRIFQSLNVLPSTMQTRGMHTVIRDVNTCREDFVFYADRLCRLAIEAALAALPFNEKTVTTPTGGIYSGVGWCTKLCGVSVIRSGEAMENALRACCAGIPIGKILIYADPTDGARELVYKKLPHDIASRHVLLMDPVISTGSSACSAIEVLKEQGVQEGSIVMLTLIAAPEGVTKVCSTYPKVKVITSEVDHGVGDKGLVLPGVGDFGDRYFGTQDGGPKACT